MSIATSDGADLGACTRALAREAHANHDVPKELAERAARATRKNLAASVQGPLGRAERARVAAYFWAVVRRHAVRRRAARAYTRATVIESIAQDLRAAGWDHIAIEREIERSYS